MTQHDHILAHWGPPENQIFVNFQPRDPPGPPWGGGVAYVTYGRGVVEGVNIRVYVYLQLQGTYIRVSTATGPGEPFRHTKRSI